MTLKDLIAGLSRDEQLIAMELLWEQLGRDPSFQPPSWHRDVVAERVRRLRDGEATLVDWADVKKNFGDRTS